MAHNYKICSLEIIFDLLRVVASENLIPDEFPQKEDVINNPLATNGIFLKVSFGESFCEVIYVDAFRLLDSRKSSFRGSFYLLLRICMIPF